MSTPEDRNITWHASSIDTRDRERLHGHRGITLWFTGLSASGKSTVAREVEDQLYNRGLHAYVLDGDNIRRIGEVSRLFAANTAMEAEAARLRDMHPSDVAHIVRTMPLAQRRQLAESMDDERLADVLEELPESEQLRLIEGLDLDRLVGVLDEMEYDDLADLLGEMPHHQRAAILAAMDEVLAGSTAGGAPPEGWDGRAGERVVQVLLGRAPVVN